MYLLDFNPSVAVWVEIIALARMDRRCHNHLFGEQTMEVTFATLEKLARWFQWRLNVSVHLPRFTRQEQSALREGRLSLMGGKRAGQLFYRWKGHTLSLFVLSGGIWRSCLERSSFDPGGLFM